MPPDSVTAAPAASPWVPGEVLVAQRSGGPPASMVGVMHAGLALCQGGWGGQRQPDQWSLVHIGSGICFFRLVGAEEEVTRFATLIAGAGDWTLFDVWGGWQQTDPDLPTKVRTMSEPFLALIAPMPDPATTETCRDRSREVIQRREGLA